MNYNNYGDYNAQWMNVNRAPYITNNISGYVITESGKLEITPYGISFYGQNGARGLVADAFVLRSMFDNQLISELIGYANAKDDNPIEQMIKNRILEIIEQYAHIRHK